jgi:hypothetical protein
MQHDQMSRKYILPNKELRAGEDKNKKKNQRQVNQTETNPTDLSRLL